MGGNVPWVCLEVVGDVVHASMYAHTHMCK